MPESDIDLSYVISLKPKKAIDYFKSLGYEISWDWKDSLKIIKRQAFTVAKVTEMDILMDLRAAVQKAIDEGIGFSKFVDELEPLLKKKGWWGKAMVDGKQVQLGSPWRLNTIYRTNIQSAYMAGRWKEHEEDKEEWPYLQYVAVMDAVTRPAHAALNGKVFRVDDPFWDTHYPPNGYKCRCRARSYRDKDLERKGLTVESGSGKISSADEGTAMYLDPITGEKLATDPGFANNPGKNYWEPDLNQYPQDLVDQFSKAMASVILKGGN